MTVKRLLLVTVVVLALSLIVTGVALAHNGGGEEVSSQEEAQAGAGEEDEVSPEGGTQAASGEGDKASVGEVALLLAPLVVAATAIERFIEMVFDLVEGWILTAGILVGEGGGYLGWARREVRNWRQAVVDVGKGQPNQKANGMALGELETALAAAKDRVKDFLQSPPYTSWKRLISLAAGIVLGIIVAFAARLQMLAMIAGLLGGGGGTGTADVLGEATRGIDMLLTGLIIGTGSAPVHSLIGLLENTKDAVDEARALWAGSADSKVAKAYGELVALVEMQRQQELRLHDLHNQIDEEQHYLRDLQTAAEAEREKARETSALEAEIAEATSRLSALEAEIAEATSRLSALREEAEKVRPMSEVEMGRLIDRRLGRF
jgi:hypothetical protein